MRAKSTREAALVRAWIISDGKAGHEAQSIGVAEALGCLIEMKRVAPQGMWQRLAPIAPVAPSERFGKPGSAFTPPWPDIAIATGRTTIPYLRALKRLAGVGTYTIVLLDPRFSRGVADLMWVPEHDRQRGPNVFTTLLPPHRFAPSVLAQARTRLPDWIAALPDPRVGVLIGGPNGDYRYTPDVIVRLTRLVTSLAESGAGLMVTLSRRSPPDLSAAIHALGRNTNVHVWDGIGDNPYPAILAAADVFLVTADSVSMCAEPAATGRPIYVFHPDGGSAKFDRFHLALREAGITRPAPAAFGPLHTWSYDPVYSATTIAREIERRLARRRHMLGSARPD